MERPWAKWQRPKGSQISLSFYTSEGSKGAKGVRGARPQGSLTLGVTNLEPLCEQPFLQLCTKLSREETKQESTMGLQQAQSQRMKIKGQNQEALQRGSPRTGGQGQVGRVCVGAQGQQHHQYHTETMRWSLYTMGVIIQPAPHPTPAGLQGQGHRELEPRGSAHTNHP